jgi:hypothetical protein
MPRSPRRRIRLASVASQIAAKVEPGWAPSPPQSLAPATGARTTRFCRTQQRRSSCAGSNRSQLSPPCDPSRAQRRRVHRSPHSTYRDDAYAPLHEAGWREEDSIFGKGKADYFSRVIWTTQITLNRLAKFARTREALHGALGDRERDRGSKRLLICPTGSRRQARARPMSIAKPDNSISEISPLTGHIPDITKPTRMTHFEPQVPQLGTRLRPRVIH